MKDTPSPQARYLDMWISAFVFLAATGLAVFGSRSRRNKLYDLLAGSTGLGDRKIHIGIIMVLSSVAFIFGRDAVDPTVLRFRNATFAAFVAFIVAVFAHLDLVIAPFWLVWILRFFYGQDAI